jgi:2-keto-myo-inositol isomerase
MTKLRFALNHMSAPSLSIEGFFAMAEALGVSGVEIRNDLSGNADIGSTPARAVRDAAERHGLTILSINALQRFNEWNDERAKEAAELIAYARDCGAKALVLVPVNDGSGKDDGVRQKNLMTALAALKPMLDAAGIIGLVEPLGFSVCSLSSKAEAANAIEELGAQATFRLVHDTFHHHLANEAPLFGHMTGLVHISGVVDPTVAVAEMRDPHRVLVDGKDRLDNIGQIRALIADRYDGPFSFEPFAAEVHTLADPAKALSASMAFIAEAV